VIGGSKQVKSGRDQVMVRSNGGLKMPTLTVIAITLIAVSASKVTHECAISEMAPILLWRVSQLVFSIWVGVFKFDYTSSCLDIVN